MIWPKSSSGRASASVTFTLSSGRASSSATSTADDARDALADLFARDRAGDAAVRTDPEHDQLPVGRLLHLDEEVTEVLGIGRLGPAGRRLRGALEQAVAARTASVGVPTR